MQTSIERDADITEFLHYLKRPMEDYNRDLSYLAKHDEELTAQYPDEWVAIFDCKVVSHSPDRAEMWRQLEQLGLDRRFLVDAFLDTDPPTLIL